MTERTLTERQYAAFFSERNADGGLLIPFTTAAAADAHGRAVCRARAGLEFVLMVRENSGHGWGEWFTLAGGHTIRQVTAFKWGKTLLSNDQGSPARPDPPTQGP